MNNNKSMACQPFKTLSLGIDNPRLVSLDAFPTLRSDGKEPQTTTPSKKITFDPHFVCMCRVAVMYNSLISIVLVLFSLLCLFSFNHFPMTLSFTFTLTSFTCLHLRYLFTCTAARLPAYPSIPPVFFSLPQFYCTPPYDSDATRRRSIQLAPKQGASIISYVGFTPPFYPLLNTTYYQLTTLFSSPFKTIS